MTGSLAKYFGFLVLETKYTPVKKRVLELLCAISSFSSKGHDTTMDALDYFKVF